MIELYLDIADVEQIARLNACLPLKGVTTNPSILAHSATGLNQLLAARSVVTIVTVIDDTEKVQVEVHWIGGHITRTTLIRPVARMDQMSGYHELLQRVKALQSQGDNAVEIALTLNAKGWRPRSDARPTMRQWFAACFHGKGLLPARPTSNMQSGSSENLTRVKLQFCLFGRYYYVICAMIMRAYCVSREAVRFVASAITNGTVEWEVDRECVGSRLMTCCRRQR